MSRSRHNVEDLVDDFCAKVRARGSRLTRQRITIARAFFQDDHHVSVDELFARVQSADADIGYATVYRTLKLMVECGVAQSHQFEDNRLRFERYEQDEHHDHLICTKCHEIVEFEDERIEELQEEVAKKFGFVLTSHRLELYGIPNECIGIDGCGRRSLP